MLWQRYPLFRIFLAFCAGILIANFLHPPVIFSVIFFILSLLLSLLTAFLRNVFFHFKNRWVFGLFLSLFFNALGLLSSQFYSEKLSPVFLKKPAPEGSLYYVQLQETPRGKARSYAAKARVLAFYDAGEVTPAGVNLMLYLEKDSAAAALRYGDRLLIRNGINKLAPPANPYEFDYRDFLHLQAIYFQAYADALSWRQTGSGYGSPVLATAGQLRRHMLQIIDNWDMGPQETAITKALLMGYRYDIDDEQLKAYASAGAMHVLAVSGLHVGIVYLMAFYMLYFLDRIKHGPLIRSAILVLLLWGFALITGLSASVVRASTMFSFVAAGTAFKRSTSVYNTILGSAMLLLLFKPTYLFEVGFQLSYAAVFGIVWLQPRFENLLHPQGWVPRQLWSITTVSLAAQVATFPLGLYYFHQFPALFLLSNLIVIPLVTLLMYLGLSALILSLAGWLPAILIRLYESLLWFMNQSVAWVEDQAYFLINEIHISRLELGLLYVIILAGFSWLFTGGYRRLGLSLAALVIFCGSQLWEQARLVNQEKLVVYAINRQAAIGLYSGSNGYLVCDSSLWKDESSLNFHIRHHWWAMDLAEVQPANLRTSLTEPVMKHENLLCFQGQYLWLYEGKSSPPPFAKSWIVCHNCYPPRARTKDLPADLILSGALDFHHRQRWRQWADTLNIKMWDTRQQGAYVLAAN